MHGRRRGLGGAGGQGEVLEQQFGEDEAAFRTLDLYTSAVLEASLAPTKVPKPEWREVMAEMSKVLSQGNALPSPPALPTCPPHLVIAIARRSDVYRRTFRLP